MVFTKEQSGKTFTSAKTMIAKTPICQNIQRCPINYESNCIEKELCDLEKELEIMKTISLYINKIIPENFPDDVKNTILADVYVF